MERTCSKCGATTPPEARFCRHCGAPLKVGSNFGTGEHISPLAQTVPLSSEGLTTSSLSSDEGTAADTRRVARAEMEHLFRRSRFEAAPDGKSDGGGPATVNSDYAAPPTGEIMEKPPAAVSAAAPVPVVARPAAASTRPRRLRVLATALLLLATLSGAILAYYFLRQRAPENAANVTNEVGGNQSAEAVNTNAAVAQSGVSDVEQPPAPPTQETTPQPAPTPSASVEPTRDVRAKQERERASETLPPASTTASPASTPALITQATPPSPSPQTTPAQTTTPATPNSTGGGPSQAAQPGVDDFYFQAVNIVNGRDPRSLPRAELLRALQLFQNVKSGPHAAEARRQATRLGRQLDRLNKQSPR